MNLDIHRVLRDVGSLLFKKGSVMTPLIALLFLVPVFIWAAYLFRSVAVIRRVPIISTLFAVVSLAIPLIYWRYYDWFAKHDPDRLQSEEYRVEVMKQTIAAKELPYPVPVENLSLAGPTENPADVPSRGDGQGTHQPNTAEEERQS